MPDDPAPRGSRCWWAANDPLSIIYHDEEWGRPVTDDSRLFEKLCLEADDLAEAPRVPRRLRGVRHRGGRPLQRCRGRSPACRPGIVRNRAKIDAAINNARATLDLIDSEGSLATFIWSFEPPSKPAPRTPGDVPANTPESLALSKALKAHGFRFVGPTTIYAFMQAMGLVNDHLESCPARMAGR